MKLPINEYYQIISDSNQWIVQQRSNKKDSEELGEWRSISFFLKFEHAVESIGNRMIRESDAVGITEALADIKRVVTALELALPREFRLFTVQKLTPMQKMA